MANSAAEPPDEGHAPEGDELDEAEMTSIMDADQRRQLQQAARALKEPEKEPDRPTARPPPEAAIAVEAEAAIPRAAAVPAEALAIQPAGEAAEPEEEPPSSPAPRAATAPSPAASPVWMVVAFVLLAAAIAFEMR